MRYCPADASCVARSRAAALVLGLALVACGCVDVEGDLAADGSLSLRYTYTPPRHATFKSERARLTSPHVRVEDLQRDQSLDGYSPREFVTATLAVDDARQIATAEAFSAVGVTLDLAKGELRLTFPGMDPKLRERFRTAAEGMNRAVRLSLVLPGPVKGAEPAATIDGRRVTWNFSLREFAALGDTVTLTASWTAAAVPPQPRPVT